MTVGPSWGSDVRRRFRRDHAFGEPPVDDQTNRMATPSERLWWPFRTGQGQGAAELANDADVRLTAPKTLSFPQNATRANVVAGTEYRRVYKGKELVVCVSTVMALCLRDSASKASAPWPSTSPAAIARVKRSSRRKDRNDACCDLYTQVYGRGLGDGSLTLWTTSASPVSSIARARIGRRWRIDTMTAASLAGIWSGRRSSDCSPTSRQGWLTAFGLQGGPAIKVAAGLRPSDGTVHQA